MKVNKIFIFSLILLTILSMAVVSAAEDNSTFSDDLPIQSMENEVISIDSDNQTISEEGDVDEGYVDVSDAYEYLNEFRTEKGVWYWMPDNVGVTYYNTNESNQLAPLERDLDLEEVAKIRAKEIVQLFDHERPDGSMCYSIYPTLNGTGAVGENIAIEITARGVTEAWKETFDSYQTQGHRRNMMDPDFNCVGIAGYRISNGDIYWVQVFGNKYIPTNKNDSKPNAPEATFKDLNSLIENSANIKLEKDYTYFNDFNFTGGIVIDKSVTVDGQGHCIDASKSARIFNIAADNVVLKNIIFKNAYIDYLDGGVIYLTGNNLTVLNCTFTDNFAYYGSAIYSDSHNVFISDCSFTDNFAVGGAIYVQNTNVNLKNCNFNGNGAIVYGACFYLTNANITASQCIFRNSTAFKGGALYLKDSKALLLDCSILDNEALAYGGAMYCDGSEGTMIGCDVSNNLGFSWKISDGGAIYLCDGNLSLKNSNFTNNSVNSEDYGEGGAICSMFGDIQVENCNFVANNATLYGGAIYLSNANIVITNASFSSNIANLSCYSTRGGAVYLDECDALMEGCSFIKNVAGDGGGFYSLGGKATLKDSSLDDNLGVDIAGAFYMETCIFLLENNVISKNGAIYGGALFLKNCNGSIKSSRMMKNYADCAGVIESVYSNITFIDSVFENNAMECYGYSNGAVLFSANDNLEFLNCNFSNNSAKSLDYVSWGGSAFIASSNVTFDGCRFENDSAGYGGAIFVRDGKLSLIGSVFENYSSQIGAIYLTNSSAIVNNTEFTNNNAILGGAIYSEQSSLFVSNSSFSKNFAEVEGGAIYLLNTVASLINSNFNENSLNLSYNSYGGAVASESSDVSLESCNFTSNCAGYYGGAFCLFSGNVSAVMCNFINNSVKSYIIYDLHGGAFYCENSNASIELCNFTNNIVLSQQKGYGGAVSSRDGNAQLLNCVFENNTASDGGAAYGCNASGSIFVGNHASNVAGAMYGVNNSAYNCKFIKNFAYGDNPTFNVTTKDCTFIDNKIIIKSTIDVPPLENEYYPGDKLYVYLYAIDYPYQLIDNATVTIKVYKNNVQMGTFDFASGECGWIVNVSEGNYFAELSIEDEEFEVDPINITFNVSRKEIATIDVVFGNYTFPNPVVIEVSSNVDANAEIYIDGSHTDNVELTGNETRQLTYTYLQAGLHTFGALITPKNTKIDSVNVTKEFEVYKKETSIKLNVSDVEDTENVIVILQTSEDGNVSVRIGDSVKSIHVNSSQKSQIDFGAIVAGEYIVEATLDAGENYLTSTDSKVLNVLKKIAPEDVQISNNDSKNITIKLPDGATGNVTLTIAGQSYDVEIINGVVQVTLPDWENGTYQYVITYSGDARYSGFSIDGTMNSDSEENPKIIPEILIPEFENESQVKLPDDAKGTVTLTVDGNNYEFEVVAGIADVKLPDLANGNYEYVIVYSGDDKYAPVTHSGSMVVNRPVVITVDNLNVTYGTGFYCTVTVKNDVGFASANVEVDIKINGKHFTTLTTDPNGKCKFSVSNAPGNYNLNITSQSKSLIKTLTIKHLLTLKKVKVKRSAKKLVLTATLAKVNNKYLKNKKITFKFNGKKYTTKTNKKGVAKVTVKSSVLKKLKVGKKVSYQATYQDDTVKKTVKIKK